MFNSIKNWLKYQKYQILRSKTDHFLNQFSSSSQEKRFSNQTVLVDAHWDNPNAWIRYALLRKALGLSFSKEIGLIGFSRRKEQKRTLKKFQIKTVIDYLEFEEFSQSNLLKVQECFNSLKSSSDLLNYPLPHGIPATFLYDYILKRKKWAFVSLNDQSILKYIHYFFNSISIAERILDQNKIDLFVCMENINIMFPLFYLLLKENIKIVIPRGEFGLLKFWKLDDKQNIYNSKHHTQLNIFLGKLNSEKLDLENLGFQIIKNRVAGKSSRDIGAEYAYQKRINHVIKKKILDQFNWNGKKKIIGVYASNWFDYPHILGMSHFEDFHDWIQATLQKAKKNKQFNWIFKGHPGDEWYGGLTLEDVIKKDINQKDCFHIGIAGRDWNGAGLIESLDAIVTYHGTIGIEATVLGKPVMISDRGWYHDCGFVKWPKSREEYLGCLEKIWWKDMDISKNKKLAQVFAGLYYGRPKWQQDFLLESDVCQWEIYQKIIDCFTSHQKIIEKEVKLIRDWFDSDDCYYHSYKMRKANDYIF